MEQLDTFIKDIIDAKQLPGITDEAKSGLVEEMRDRLIELINRAMVESLPEDKVAGFSALLDVETTTSDDVQNYIVASGVDVEKVTAKTMLDFRDLYLQPASQRDK
jgi:hypothetical protein